MTTRDESRPQAGNPRATEAFGGAVAMVVEAPRVQARDTYTDRRGVRSVGVRCPFCGRTHRHGWPAGESEPGHRLAHCMLGDYRIEAP